MRQMHVCHRPFWKVASIYLDDTIVKEMDNLKEHIMQFCTIAYNDHRRGLVYEAKKAKIACDEIKFFRFVANGMGIKLHIEHDVFQILINRKHSSLKSLQRTISSLQ